MLTRRCVALFGLLVALATAATPVTSYATSDHVVVASRLASADQWISERVDVLGVFHASATKDMTPSTANATDANAMDRTLSVKVVESTTEQQTQETTSSKASATATPAEPTANTAESRLVSVIFVISTAAIFSIL